ncbi:amidohydrolase [Anopheles sinensis]|uniref:Amidohydrolase n=1 Tax=Anopheles sinensis TaxID=74873 RepID=A0A084WTW6_ANOSI|nr:amidohydrolase [Anopheles sinensis]
MLSEVSIAPTCSFQASGSNCIDFYSSLLPIALELAFPKAPRGDVFAGIIFQLYSTLMQHGSISQLHSLHTLLRTSNRRANGFLTSFSHRLEADNISEQAPQADGREGRT